MITLHDLGGSDVDQLREDSNYVSIKYGSQDSDQFELEILEGDTRESLMGRAKDRIAAIHDLQKQINAIKIPAKKQKIHHTNEEGNAGESQSKQDC